MPSLMQSTNLDHFQSVALAWMQNACWPIEEAGRSGNVLLGVCEGVREESEEFLLGTQLFHKLRNMYDNSLAQRDWEKPGKTPVSTVSVLAKILTKTIPATGQGAPQGCEMPRLPHFLDNQPTDSGQGASLMHQPPFTPRKIPGAHFC
jgi:hypothetical protein